MSQVTNDPTITAIPGILIRIVCRTLARLIMILMFVVFSIALGLAYCSLFLLTFKSSRSSTQASLMKIVMGALELYREYKHENG